ncbi:DUF418 domain-containing protein [Thermobacillus sp. ZCTH02-B1]|uniref:DUF418 domain-containing protein n=1 Tax=Thermobacillus sp. ZCTH02-B1 TaxID=1858795 RepID=UPI0025DDC276|nr:DUF418 domain-containing protein [Thermobacillus sp. ZCTH02-B1]
MNVPEMAGNGVLFRSAHEGSDALIRLLFDMFVQTKFYTIFAFLFGMSFHLFIRSAGRRGAGAGAAARRFGALLVFGAAHAILLWHGDILLTYALLGFLLLPFIRRQDETVAAWGWSLIGVAIFIHTLLGLSLLIMPANPISGPVFADGYPGPAERIEYLYTDVAVSLLLNGVELFGLFLLGMYAGRRGWFNPGAVPARRLAAIQRVSLAVGLTAAAPMAIAYAKEPVYHFEPHYLYIFLSGKALAVFYVATLMRLAGGGRSARFRPLAAVGRMAFTNYLTQTILTVGLVYALRIEPGALPLWATLLWSAALLVLQTYWSIRWLRRYRMGPFEWIWRLCTWLRAPAMRREAAGADGTGMPMP